VLAVFGFLYFNALNKTEDIKSKINAAMETNAGIISERTALETEIAAVAAVNAALGAEIKAADETDNRASALEAEAKELTDRVNKILPANAQLDYEPRMVYLTFDDGPSANTPKILNILKEHDVKATFFVVGYGESYHKYMKDIVNDGHKIALHTYSHDYAKIYKSDEAYFEDLNKLRSRIKDLTGAEPDIIRFPGGSSNTISKNHSQGIMTRLTKEVVARGFRYFDWNIDSGDANRASVPASEIVSNVINQTGSKKVCNVLLHDMNAKSTTVDALSDIIKFYREKGFIFDVLTSVAPGAHQTINN
jgi:peptidoglycan/xylan/chitin deacetylase (PgdA/CDA1 family)